MALRDIGHEQTDKTIEEIERRLQKEYRQAYKEVEQKYNEYMQRFKGRDAEMRQVLDAGKITQEEYNKWRYGQVCVGGRWKELKETLANDLKTVDMKARSITQGYMPEVYAVNHNYATYQVERDSMIDTSYTLYNRRAVENMIRDDRTLLPYPREDSPTAKMLMERKDLAWNQEKIHSAITQGILQGESNPQIARRLERVVGMDRAAAVRNARTMMTGVENKARQDAYDDLRDKGIEIREKWIATLDARTRSSHRWMHGTYKDERGVYENGLEYPGDPKGDPAEVYNCRCCEIAEVMGHSIDTPKYSPKLKEMSFDEWRNGKSNLKGINTAELFESRIGEKTTGDFSLIESRLNKINVVMEDSLRQLDYELVSEFTSGIEKMKEQYPELPVKVISADVSAIKQLENSFAGASPNGIIYLNYKAFQERNSFVTQIMLNEMSGQFVEGVTLESLGVHESAHMFELYFIQKQGITDAATIERMWQLNENANSITDTALLNMGRNLSEKEKLSATISNNATIDAGELLSDSFLDVFVNEKNAQDYSKKIKEEVERRMKK